MVFSMMENSTPTRASLLSGRYAHQSGLVFPLLSHPIAGLPLNATLLPEALQQGGYATYMVRAPHMRIPIPLVKDGVGLCVMVECPFVDQLDQPT